MIHLTGTDGEHAVLHDLGGSGPPLLLTHGNSLNTGMWATVVPQLQDGFHCWGLDFRGHGSARPQHDDMSVERSRFVDEVMAQRTHSAAVRCWLPVTRWARRAWCSPNWRSPAHSKGCGSTNPCWLSPARHRPRSRTGITTAAHRLLDC